MQRFVEKAAGLLLLLLTTGAARAQSVTPIPQLDLNRFTGTWYEIARLPWKREKRCERDAFVQVALADKAGRFQLVSACRYKNGDMNADNANGKFEKAPGKLKNETGDGRLKISYLWPFYTKFWVLATGPNYQWALVGSPNHKNLWIFSRTPLMDPAQLARIKSQAAAEGFAITRLVQQPQNPRTHEGVAH